jgi:hypothetical protein
LWRSIHIALATRLIVSNASDGYQVSKSHRKPNTLLVSGDWLVRLAVTIPSLSNLTDLNVTTPNDGSLLLHELVLLPQLKSLHMSVKKVCDGELYAILQSAPSLERLKLEPVNYDDSDKFLNYPEGGVVLICLFCL